MRLVAIVLWAAFAAIVIAIGTMLLPACGLLAWFSGFGLNYCAPSLAVSVKAEAETFGRRAQELELEVAKNILTCLARSGPAALPGATGPARLAPSVAPQRTDGRTAPPLSGPAASTEVAADTAASPASTPAQTQATPTPAPGPLKLPQAPTSDLSFLKGCWRTDPFRHSPEEPPGQSTYCFDESGAGQLQYGRASRPDYTCRMAAQAAYEGEQLHIRDSDTTCSDGSAWFADDLSCRRAGDEVAECSGQAATPRGTTSWMVKLHRVN